MALNFNIKLEVCPGTAGRASVTLTFDLPQLNLQMAHSTHYGEESCRIIFKSIHASNHLH